MLPIIITTNQYQYALAKTITSGTLTLDTDKPLAPQFNQALLKSKTTLSPAEYKSKVETLQSSI